MAWCLRVMYAVFSMYMINTALNLVCRMIFFLFRLTVEIVIILSSCGGIPSMMGCWCCWIGLIYVEHVWASSNACAYVCSACVLLCCALPHLFRCVLFGFDQITYFITEYNTYFPLSFDSVWWINGSSRDAWT